MPIPIRTVVFLFLIVNFILVEPVSAQQVNVNNFEVVVLTKADSAKRERAKQLAIINWQKQYGCTKPDYKKIEAAKQQIKRLGKKIK